MTTTDLVFPYRVVLTFDLFMRLQISDVFRWLEDNNITEDLWTFSSVSDPLGKHYTISFVYSIDATAFRLRYGI